jgi:hypothetical protein
MPPLSEILRLPPPEALEGFLLNWYGPRFREKRPAVWITSAPMPAPLRHFYSTIASWPDAIVQNHLLAPRELPHLKKEDWADITVEDGKLVFYVENQGVCKWATSGEDGRDDAPVWIRGSTIVGELEDWELEEPPLSAFLLQLLVFEAILGAEHGASVAWLDRPTLARVVEPLQPLPFGAWCWPGYPSEFYVGDSVVAFAGPNPGPGETGVTEYVSLSLGALDADALGYLEEIATAEWEWFSPRDGSPTGWEI